jgi:hypothetical protein
MANSKSRSTPPGQGEIGYRSPPRGSRFRPGQSGNPKGRPRGSRNFRTDLKSTLDNPVRLKEEGKARKVSTQEAALLRLREKALSGDARALDRLIQLAQAHNNDDAPIGGALSAEDRQVLAIFAQRVLNGAAEPYSRSDAEPSSASQSQVPDQTDKASR